MATTLTHSFESGQSSGTTITTGNSGVGGDAFDTTSIGAGAAPPSIAVTLAVPTLGLLTSSAVSAATIALTTTLPAPTITTVAVLLPDLRALTAHTGRLSGTVTVPARLSGRTAHAARLSGTVNT